jgi:hypothetical protein
MLTIHSDYTEKNHLLVPSDPDAVPHKLQSEVLDKIQATWCPRCRLGRGWLIKKDDLKTLKKLLADNNISYKLEKRKTKPSVGPKKGASKRTIRAGKGKTAPTRETPQRQHPPYEVMIATAIKEIKDRKGATRQAIKHYVRANYKVPDNFDTVFRTQLNRLTDDQKLLQINSQRFRLSDELKKKY